MISRCEGSIQWHERKKNWWKKNNRCENPFAKQSVGYSNRPECADDKIIMRNKQSKTGDGEREREWKSSETTEHISKWKHLVEGKTPNEIRRTNKYIGKTQNNIMECWSELTFAAARQPRQIDGWFQSNRNAFIIALAPECFSNIQFASRFHWCCCCFRLLCDYACDRGCFQALSRISILSTKLAYWTKSSERPNGQTKRLYSRVQIAS